MDKRIFLAGCVFLDGNGRVLLMHRSTPGKRQWELPGGKIKEGEEPWEAAVREAREELGVEAAIAMELGSREFIEGAEVMRYSWFLATFDSGEPKVVEQEKFDKLGYFSFKELDGMKPELSANVRNLVRAYFDEKRPLPI